MLIAGFVYSGFTLFLVGCASLVKPVMWLGIASRGCSVLVLSSGLLVMIVGLVLPAAEKRSVSSDTQLDQFVPIYQFQEFHSLKIDGNADQVYRAIKGVTASEIPSFHTLTWIRRCGRALPEGILNVPKGQPVLEVATRTSFQLLAEGPGREIVLGTLVEAPPGSQQSTVIPQDFKTLRAPGWALAAINFRVNDAGRGMSLISTETRVYATDTLARRKFACYWRVIYPRSALIRRMWLRAIKRRAERPLESSEDESRAV
jgi:hypothetical protein